jgi:hypothetical protein
MFEALMSIDAWRPRILRATHARRKESRALSLSVLALALASATFTTGAAAAPLTIVVHAAPFPTVAAAAAGELAVNWNDALPADDDACTESYAAVELRDLLARCPGMATREIVLASGDQLPPGDVIVLGNPRSQPLVRTLLAGALSDAASPDAFRVRAMQRDGRTVWVVAGASRTGTLYGTYALLERLGVRFYGPAAFETIVPTRSVSLPAHIDATSAPAFAWRGFWAWEPRGDPAFFRWMARRRLNLWTSAERQIPLLHKLGIRLTGGGHTLQADYLDPNARGRDGHTRFEAHPEWFGLHDGRRSPNIGRETGDNFCTSNAAAVAELGRNLVRGLREGALANADLVQVWPLDGGRWCECDQCRALGSPSDRALDLVRRLAAMVREAARRGELRRDVVLSAAAYLETTQPPSRPVPAAGDERDLMVTFFPYYRCYAHALADPSCVEMNQRLEAAWQGWAAASGRTYRGPVGVCEYYNVSWFKTLPLVFPHVIARDVADARAAGARLFSYMHVPTSRWGTWRLDHLVLSEALWAPGFDVDSLIADYTARAYPGSGAEALSFHSALETATANIFAIELTVGGVFAVAGHPEGRLGVRSMPLFPYAHLPYTAAPRDVNAAPAWSEVTAAMRTARTALDRARRVARTPDERARLDDDARRFEYGELTFALYDRLVLLARADHGEAGIDVRRALTQADSIAARLKGVRDVVQVAGTHADAADGLEASHVAPTLTYFHSRFGDAGSAGR